MFHKAGWISAHCYPDMFPNNANSIVRSAYLRKVFAVAKSLKSATLTICALGLGVAYINEQPVTDTVLSTPFTVYDKRVCYNKYDVTSLLKEGENCLAVHLGNGFYNNNMEAWNDKMAPWRDIPKMIASLHLIYTDGSEDYIDSNKTFRSYPGPVLFNHMRQGELYDARCEEIGFSSPSFNDSHWSYARRANHPGGIYELNDAPSIRVTQEISPVKCENNIYDFGINISGWVKIETQAERGCEITLSYDERLTEDRKHLYSSWEFERLSEEEKPLWRASNAITLIEGLPFSHKDVYICRGGKTEMWSPSFCYHGFRYVKVENAPKDFKITAQVVHSDLKTIGTFTSDSSMLNTIHEMCIRSTLSNNVGIPTDCPHREQNGWPGDALLASRQAFLNFDIYEHYRSWIKNYKDVQRPSGQLPCLIPTASWGFNWGTAPITDSAIINIPYYGYLYTGNTAMVSELWDNMVRYMDYIASITTENGLVEYGLSPDWSCSNLAVPCPLAACDTAYIYDDCIKMSKLAKLMGADETMWLQKASAYRAAWQTHFSGHEEYWESQTFLAIALYFNLFEETEKAAAAKKLAALIEEQDYHFNCGILGVSMLFTVLTENGYIEHLYKAVTNKTYPSYAYWVLCGLTTLAEDWDMSQSQNHQMFSEVDHWFYKYLGGIKHTEQGLVIEPIPLKDINYVKVTHRGITVERNQDVVTVTLPCPAKIKIGATETNASPGTYTFSMA